jgi:Gpi18-like mannosyltransferase
MVAGIAIRLLLLPSNGFEDDITQFVQWVRYIGQHGLGEAYTAPLSFGPVMAYIWAALASIDPTFLTAGDGSDDMVRMLIKLPAVVADLGLAGVAWLAVRDRLPDRPHVAAAAAAVILLHPAVWFLSAWWGQAESIFALLVLLGYLAAVRDRFALATIALTAALMTKPQVAVLLVPFGFFVLARVGWRSPASLARLAGLAVVALATAVVLWLPFIPAGGPARYLAALATYQSDVYSVLSLNAWNLWWLIQQAIGHGAYVQDNQAIIGPLTFRVIGYLVTLPLLLVVGGAVYRRATARTLALGIAAAALVSFAFLTTMHERYAYAAVVFLALLVEDRRARLLALALGITFTLNLVGAATSDVYLESPITVDGPIGLAGSVAMIVITVMTVLELLRSSRPEPTLAADAAHAAAPDAAS